MEPAGREVSRTRRANTEQKDEGDRVGGLGGGPGMEGGYSRQQTHVIEQGTKIE